MHEPEPLWPQRQMHVNSATTAGTFWWPPLYLYGDDTAERGKNGVNQKPPCYKWNVEGSHGELHVVILSGE